MKKLGIFTICLLLAFSSSAISELAFESESQHEAAQVPEENQRNNNLSISLFRDDTSASAITSWNVKCEGENVTSLTLLPCESIEECKRAKLCLETGIGIGNSTDRCNSSSLDIQDFVFGSSCPHQNLQIQIPKPTNESHNQNDNKTATEIKDPISLENSTASSKEQEQNQQPQEEQQKAPEPLPICFHVKIPRAFPSGLIECKSMRDGEEKQVVDYFYTMTSPERKVVLSSHSNSTESQENLQLDVYFTRPSQNLLVLPAKVGRETRLYSNQEVVVDCKVPKFMYKNGDPDGEIRVIKKDETYLNYDPKLAMTVTDEDSLNWHKRISHFRVYNEIHGFACRVRSPANSSEWIEKSFNFSVLDPPSVFTARSKTGEIFNVTQAMRCGLTGSPHKNKSLMSKYFSLLQLFEYKLKVSGQEFKIKDPFQYLRFQEIAGDDYYCYNDNPRTQNQHTKEKTTSGYFPEQPVDFKLTAPVIEKPQGAIVKIDNRNGKNSSVKNLLCKFSGSPEPYIFWLKNGLEFLYSLSEKSEDFVTLQLPLSLPLPLNSENVEENNKRNKTLTKKIIDNYSCIARNFVGHDRLDFLVTT